MDSGVRRVRHVFEGGAVVGRHQFVLGQDFPRRLGDTDFLRRAFGDGAGVAQIFDFVAQGFAGFRVLQRLARAQHVPACHAGRAAGREGVVAGPQDHPLGVGAENVGRVVHRVPFDHARLRKEGMDRVDGDGGNGFGGDFGGAHARRELDGGHVGFAALDQCQPGGRATAVQHDQIAGVDPVRVLDLVAVQIPDLGPAPGILEEFAGDIPEGVALDDDILVRRVRLQFERVGEGRRGQQQGERNDELTHGETLHLDLV